MSLLSQARTARPIVTYDGVDVTKEVYPSLIELIYKEGIQFSGDALMLRLADPEGRFRLTWTLKAVVPLTLSFHTENWNYPGEIVDHVAGSFMVSRVDISQSKPGGTVVNLYASSISPASSGRLERKSFAWDSTNLQELAGQIAQKNNLSLHYLTKDNPTLARVDQHDESDYNLLNRLCKQHDLFLKVKNGGLWIRGYSEQEALSAIGTIICPTKNNPGGINGVGGVESWYLTDNVEDVYANSESAWRSNQLGATVKSTATDPGAEAGLPTLHTKENPHVAYPTSKPPLGEGQVPGAKAGEVGWAGPLYDPPATPHTDELADSTGQALAKLKSKNRKRRKHSFVLPLNLTVESSTVYAVSGFAKGFDGNWLVLHVEHHFLGKSGAGSTTTLDIHKCLDF